ncbi:MAG: hypothetical protein DYG89_31940 [Caldilinea sp. CFX5]|nr:hypothetical protein [Caldilinea sp. CFX5]
MVTQSHPSIKSLQWLMTGFRHWQTLLIIAAVLCISTGLPMNFAPSRLVLVIALLLAMGGALFFLYYPQWGIITLFITGLLAPSPALPGGLNFAVLQLSLLVALWLLKLLVTRRERLLVPSRPVRPLLYLVGVTLVAFAVGQLPWFPVPQRAPMDAQIGATLIFVLAVGAFLLVAHEVQELRWLEWMTWLLLILGGLFALGWVSPVSAITATAFQRGATANALFWTWLIALSFSLALFHETLAWRWRALAGGICLLSLYVTCVLQYDWKSAWLPPLVAIGVIVAARSWRLGLFLAVAGYLPAQIISSRAIATDEYSYSTRMDAWVIIVKMLGVNPILGFGPANYYWYTPLFRIRGYAVQFNSHNQYLDILAQIGFLGLGCVLWFFAEAAWLGWRLCSEAPKGFARAYVYATLGGLAGTAASGMLVDWFFPFVYNIGFNGFRSSIFAWLFLGGLVSIEQIVRRQSDASQHSS